MFVCLTLTTVFTSLIISHVSGAAPKVIKRMRMEAGAQEPIISENFQRTQQRDRILSVNFSPSDGSNRKDVDMPPNNSGGISLEPTNGPELSCLEAPSCSGRDNNSCQSRCNTTTKTCDCQGMHLTCVPQNLPEGIEILHLGHNEIRALNDFDFCHYRSLMHLDLKQNNISVLSENCFYGLTNLTELNMEDNRLTLTRDTYPDNVFLPLVSLQRLKINRNNYATSGNFSYPDKALSRMKNLTTLFMDGLSGRVFGEGFSEMTSLISLTLAGYLDGYCDLGGLTKDTFENLKSLTMLNMSNCHLKGSAIDREAFAPLSNLLTLDLHYNEDIGLHNVAKITWGLRNSSLIFLDLSTTESRYSTGKHVNGSHVMNLPATLQVLKVAGNSIETLDPNIFQLLPPNLTQLDVGKNKFVFGSYLCGLVELKNLTTLYLNGEDFLYDIPTTFPFQNEPPPGRLTHRRWRRFASSFYCNGSSVKSFSLPEKLTRIEMNNAGLEYRFSPLSITPNNSIEFLSFNRNYIPELIGPFTGLENLTELNISSSFVTQISPSFFGSFPNLKALRLNDNFLGNYFINQDYASIIFANLSKLEVLELTLNELEFLPDQILSELVALQHLDLSTNRLRNFTVNIAKIHNLSFLNLSSNNLREFPLKVRDAIDKLKDIRVDLSDNPIECSCNNIQFLEWLAAKTVVFGDYKYYKCLKDDGSLLVVHDGYSSVLQVLRRECSSNKVLFILILAATLLVLAVIIGLVIFRYRWTLRYLYHAALLSYQQRKGASSPGEYTYDVFISYAHPDERFVVETVTPELEKRGLRVHVHGRNFVAGNFIASNIVSAVSASRKTLVILTSSLLKSHWCNYEVQMANMEAVYSGRPVLVFLLKENVPSYKLGSLVSFIRNNTYMPYPLGDGVSERERKAFWEKLARDLR